MFCFGILQLLKKIKKIDKKVGKKLKKDTKLIKILSKIYNCYIKLIAIFYVEGIGYLRRHISIILVLIDFNVNNECIVRQNRFQRQ